MKKAPLFSIVTISYNEYENIEATLCSILNQTYDNYEYIVIDGGSTDGTLEIINKYSKNINYYLSESDNGIFDAMNKGLYQATGKYILFMNAGDIFYNKEVLKNISSNNLDEYNFIYGDTVCKKANKKIYKKAKPFFLSNKISCMGICHQSIFIDTQIAKKIGFDISLKYTADYKMIYTAFKQFNMKSFYLQKAISIFDNINGVSTQNYLKTFDEICSFWKEANYYQKKWFIWKNKIIFHLYYIYQNI